MQTPTLELVRRTDQPTGKPHARRKGAAKTLCASSKAKIHPLAVLDPATVTDLVAVCATCRMTALSLGATIPFAKNTTPVAS